MNDRKAVTVENNRRIEKKFAECEKWVADNLINCGCVFTNHSELLQKQRQEEDKYFRVISISGEELYERSHDKIPVFFVEDVFKEKYVNLKQNCNSEGE